MTWFLRGLSGPTVVASGDITLTEPTGTAEGDILHVVLGFRLDAAFSVPGDWTIIEQHLDAGTGTSSAPSSMMVARCLRGASAPGLTFTRTGGDVCLGRIIAHYSDSGVPTYDTHAFSVHSGFTSHVIVDGLTTADDGELIVAFGAGEGAWSNFRADDPVTGSGSTDTTTAPTAGAWIERADSTTTTGTDTGSAIADAVKATAGNTGNIIGSFATTAAQPLLAVAYKTGSGAAPEITLDSTEAGDTAAITLTTPSMVALDSTEAGDISVFTLTTPSFITLDSTESGDVATIAIDLAYLTEYEVITSAAMGGPSRNAVFGEGRLFVSTIDQSTQNVRVSRMQGTTWTHATLYTHTDGGGADIHNNGTVAIDGDGYVHAALCDHDGNLPIKLYKSATPYGLDFGSATDLVSGGNYNYPNLIWFSGALWLFYQTGGDRDVYYKTSTDGGATWATAVRLYNSGSGNRAYFEVSVVGSELCFATSFSNAGDVTQGTNHGYFARWNGTNWLSAAGDTYTLPIGSTTTEKFFDAAAADRDMGFFAETVKDATNRYVIYTTGLTDAATDKLYMCRYDGGWSQTEIVIPGATFTQMPHVNAADAYDFVTQASYSGTTHLVRCKSSDSGATWSFQRLTDGVLDRPRNGTRRIHGRTDPTWTLYSEITRTSNTSWTSDIYTTFNDTGVIFLDGNASAASTSAADISTAIQMAGASVSTAAATGTITTGLQLAGAAASIATADGNLTTAVTLSGAAIAQAAAGAQLATGIPLIGAATGTAAATGTLTTDSAGLEGNAQALATALGVLTIEIRLAGAALAQALATADLTAPGSGMVGAAQAQAGASGALGTAIQLIGEATATAGATGELGVPILLSGAAASTSTATGDLTLSIALEGHSLAAALASGSLSTQIVLDGAAVSQALATGALFGVERVTSARRTFNLLALPRTLRIAA